jgi:DNA-binding MarR family transcriptional regulator
VALNDSGERDRRQLIAEVLGELIRWDARDRMGAFRKWHQGSLSLVHLNVLAVLQAAGPLPMSRLAESLDVSDASATGIVDRMERRGLVERRHDTDDRRVVSVHLTQRGAATLDELGEQRRERLSRLLERMTDEELAGFLAGVRALHAAGADLYRTGEPSHAEPGEAAR